MTAPFSITFDYLCPFARNANESVIEGLLDGEEWDVTFRPFSLSQTKVEHGQMNVWDRPADGEGVRGVLALQWGLAVRDNWPDQFLSFHLALFEARHEGGADIGDPDVLGSVAEAVGLSAKDVATEVASGRPAKTLAFEHADAVSRWDVFGVPTFIVGDEAVFVRCMKRHRPDEIAKIVDLVDWTNLNEFKRTRIPR